MTSHPPLGIGLRHRHQDPLMNLRAVLSQMSRQRVDFPDLDSLGGSQREGVTQDHKKKKNYEKNG